MTAPRLLGTEWTSWRHFARSIFFHSSRMTSFRDWMLDGEWCSTCLFRIPHRCSIGFRSSEVSLGFTGFRWSEDHLGSHPSCSYYYLLSPSILFFAHLIVFALFIFIPLHILLLFLFFYHIYALVLCYFYIIFILFFCTVHWADLISLHFTSDYTLYNLLCDK